MAPSRVSPDPTVEPTDGLTQKQITSFQRDGYLIIPDYLSSQTCQNLLQKTHQLLTDFPLADHPMTKFTTGTDADGNGTADDHVGDDYFLSSGDKVRFFFEEDAFDPKTGELNKPKEKAINKIGHNLHGLVPEFGNVSHAGEVGRRNAAIARQLGYRDPRLLQSMVICKQPEIGGAVPPHQDSTFLYTRQPSAVGFWIALEDATVENGCLSFAPGSHRRAPVKERFVRKADNSGTTFEPVSEEGQWPRDFEHETASNKAEEYVLGEVKAGTLVLIHGNILHKSEKNTSQKGRIIYTFHLIEGEEHYDEKNWLQVPGGAAAFTKLDGKS
jgi:phytanoyl-CoA hydroxylase